jgi:thioredoxin-related protein
MTRRSRFGVLLLLCGLSVQMPVEPSSARAEGSAAGTAVLTDDGLYTQPWFVDSFLDLRDDLADATAQGKRFAVVWEQRGCPYCREMHTVTLQDPEIGGYVRDRFSLVQLNLFGAREVTDFDGEKLPEKALARKWGVKLTPTIMFFPDAPPGGPGKDGKAIEVARMPGLLKPFAFLSMFRFVAEKRYGTDSFQHYLDETIQALRREGKPVSGM